MPKNLNQITKIQRCSVAVVAGSTDVNGDGVDLSLDGGYDGVLFIALLGTLTASQVTALHAQQSSDDADADAYSDIEGSSVGPMADDDDDQCLVLDVFQPNKKWVRPVLDRATANAVVDGIIAVCYRGHKAPSTHDALTIALSGEVFQPVEGTA